MYQGQEGGGAHQVEAAHQEQGKGAACQGEEGQQSGGRAHQAVVVAALQGFQGEPTFPEPTQGESHNPFLSQIFFFRGRGSYSASSSSSDSSIDSPRCKD